jgi:predicted lipid-binding transport protein (Tim44 family)
MPDATPAPPVEAAAAAAAAPAPKNSFAQACLGILVAKKECILVYVSLGLGLLGIVGLLQTSGDVQILLRLLDATMNSTAPSNLLPLLQRIVNDTLQLQKHIENSTKT